VTQTVLPTLEASADPALFRQFLDSDLHQALSVCLALRPPVEIAVLG
jgi:hypothetical protein